MDWAALGAAAGLVAAMAAAEAALSARDLPQWLASLQRPRLWAPLWLWVTAAGATYLIQGFVAYRLLARPLDPAAAVALAALVAVMAANVAYNIVLSRRRRPRDAYLGLLWFLPPLAVLQAALFAADTTAALVNLAYVLWVVVYDLPIMRGLDRLNRARG